MSGFTAEWLSLREPFDAAARAAALVTDLRAQLAQDTEVVDLGAGAGSNLRYLAPLLGGTQRWRLVDHDAALLDAALVSTHAWAAARGARSERRGDKLAIHARDFECELRCERRELGTVSELELPAGCLVTAAALLDLVSAEWLDALASRCTRARARVLFALTYDGRTLCTPAEPEDTLVVELFNRHQRGDKGFGRALGPDAARVAEAAFLRHGYTVSAHESDWQIDAREHAMQLALLEGWFGAAVEIAPDKRAPLAAWHERRRAHVAAGRSTLNVSHVDVAGWP
jgi:hypothetical protein